MKKETSCASESDTAFIEKLQSYAHLVIRKGCNLQADQRLYLTASVECAPFVRLLTEEAYKAGAKHVTVAYSDERVARLSYDYCALELFETIPEWSALRNNWLAREGAAMLHITSEDPLAMTGIDPAKPMAAAKAAHIACKEYYDALHKGHNTWCIVAAASSAWAQRVFPELEAEEAITRLWNAIFSCVRVDSADPVEAWTTHRVTFDERKAWLNAQGFSALRYHNSLGTDVTIGLNPHGIWQGGGDVTISGVEFFPNMPTEEVFTTPDPATAHGTVVGSVPLIHHGTRIDGFSFTFEGGRAVSCRAAQGEDMLKALLEVDEGAARLGEVALVPHGSPIQRSGILFLNTLFDENASCHLAFGKGFPDCVEGGQEMDEEALKDAGVNESAIHVDFMIGTADLCIEGIYGDGSSTPVFLNGNWA